MTRHDFYTITDEVGRHFLINLNTVLAIVYVPDDRDSLGPLKRKITFRMVDGSEYSFTGPLADSILEMVKQ